MAEKDWILFHWKEVDPKKDNAGGDIHMRSGKNVQRSHW